MIWNRCILLILLPMIGGGSGFVVAQQRPNVLLIVADDLGYSDLGCYGGEIETPNLNRLAEGGLRLTRFYNAGRCCPSRASILTGYYPHRVGLGHMTQDIGQPGYRGRLRDGVQTIAQAIEPAGYRSFLSGKWHLGTNDPTRHGFEEFYGTLVSAKRFWDPDHFLRLPAGRTRRSYPAGQFYGTDAVADHAIDFLQLADQTPQQPWFLYVAFNAPHFPLQARRADIEKYAQRYHVGWDDVRSGRLKKMKTLGLVHPETQLSPRDRYWDYGQVHEGINPAWDDIPEDRRLDLARRMAIYAAMVDCMDRNIGRIIQRLRANGQLEQTLIIFTSDNGACAEWDPWGFDISSSPQNILHRGQAIETMGGPGTFHSAGSGWAMASNTPWRLYKHFNHEGGIAAPCILFWPDRMKRQGEIDDTPTHIIDLLPTIADAAGVTDVPDDLPGQSMIPLLGSGKVAPRWLFFEHEGNRAVTDGRWKLVALRDQPWELYDTSNNRTETKNLASEFPQRVAEMNRRWNQWADENHVTPLPSDYHVDYLRSNP